MVDGRMNDPHRRARDLLQRDRDQFLIKALQALRVQRLRRRARELLELGAVMREAVDRARARRSPGRTIARDERDLWP
jgi:hypothetical protein